MTNRLNLKKLISNTAALVCVLFTLISCTSKVYLDAEDKTAETISLTNDLLKPAHVVVTDEAFIDTRPIFHKYHPAWVKRKLNITINEETTLDELITNLFKNNSKIKVMMDNGLAAKSKNLKISPKTLSGTLVNLVDKISKELDIHYSISGFDLVLGELETRIFQLGILPGGVDYSMGRSEESSRATGSVGGDLRSGHVKYTAPAGAEPWTNLEKILNKYKSANGQFTTNKDTATITIIDKPSVVKKVEDFITKYNKVNMQQVGIKIQVLEVELSEGFKRGIDWDLIRKSLRTDLNINFDFTNPTNILGAISGSSLGAIDWNIIDPKNHYSGSGFLVQYIEEQGNVSIVSEPRFTVLNNQVSELAIISDEGYVKSRTVTPAVGLGDPVVGTTPGSIRTGFKLYVLPTIIKGEILLQITTSISRKVSLDGFGDDGNGNPLLQLPQINDRRFTQRSVVPNNSTLVLTGFKEQQAGTSGASPFKFNLAGGQTAAKKTTEIVILVTPVIIRG